MNPPTLVDVRLHCVACGLPFVCGAGEQACYAKRDQVLPKRCHMCRRANRRRRWDARAGVS